MATAERLQSCPTPQELSAFRKGLLDDAELERFAEHLAQCDSCSWRLAIDASGDAQLAKLRRALEEPPVIEEIACAPVAGISRDPDETFAPGSRPTGKVPLPPTLGPFELLQPLSGGGMGDVYKARHTHLKKIVAIKTLAANRSRDPSAVARFLREMEAGGGVPDHPHVVRCTHADQHGATHYLVMEFIPGIDLAKLIAIRGPLPIADACELTRQAALGLAHLHAHGRIHRDIKPGNLMLSDRGLVKILDLGLALMPNDEGRDDQLTAHLTVMGTADYMAPEQFFDSHRVSVAADLYSLGCTLFKLLTGRAPFEGESSVDLARKWRAHTLQSPPRVSHFRGDVPPGLDALVERLLSKDAEGRGAGAAVLAEELTAFCQGQRVLEMIAAMMAGDVELSADSTKPIQEATLIQRPSLRPPAPARPRESRWPSWIVAAVVGVAAPVVVSAALHWSFPRGGSGDQRAATQPSLEPGVWHRALDFEPQRITLPTLHEDGDFSWNPDRENVSLVGMKGTTRLQVGAIPVDRSYMLDVGVRAIDVDGNGIGIFFGHHQNPASQLPDEQRLVLQRLPELVQGKPAFQLELVRQRGDASTVLAILPLGPLADREHSLHIHVSRDKGLVEVLFDRVVRLELPAPDAGLSMLNEEFAGPFGIYVSRGTATFRQFRYMILAE